MSTWTRREGAQLGAPPRGSHTCGDRVGTFSVPPCPACASLANFGTFGEGKHGKSPAQAIVRWHLDEGLIVIPKSVNPGRIRQNIDVFDFRLDDDDRARIAALDSPSGRIGPDPETAAF